MYFILFTLIIIGHNQALQEAHMETSSSSYYCILLFYSFHSLPQKTLECSDIKAMIF